jgi:hypothetical protein
VAEPGVYRVVGREGEEVSLLYVADEAGHRTHTGRVDTYSERAVDERFVPAENPDDGSRLPRALAGVGVGLLVVAGLSWVGVLTTPATAGTLAVVGLLLLAAGRVVDG